MGGHSLGGAMAARYTYNNYSKLSGLILLASYPADNNDLSDKDIKVLSIYGGNDGITSLKKIDNSRDNLPDDTEYIEIKGGNHSQFGWYGFQDGDKKASISREKQQALIIDAIRKFLSDMTTGEDLGEDVEN
ncbi:MAG: alpha/beta hydrolase [bacterium]